MWPGIVIQCEPARDVPSQERNLLDVSDKCCVDHTLSGFAFFVAGSLLFLLVLRELS
jgi:hypothetical protein